MEFFEVIHGRESIRNYEPGRIVPKEVLKRILEAGRVAPSAANRQPWRFIVVSSEEVLHKVRPCYNQQWFHDAPHILVVVGNKDEAWVRAYDKYNSIETDMTIAMDHMILAAENEGIATCWIAAFNPSVLREALALKDDQRVFALTPLGYPRNNYAKKGTKQRKSLDEIVEFI